VRALFAYLPICLFALIIFQNNSYALVLKISRSVGETRGQYGKNSSLDGVERLQRSYTSFSVEKDWDKWFGSSSFTNNNYSENDSGHPESIIDVKLGKSFGNKANQLGFFLVLSQNNNYIPLHSGSVSELEKVGFLGKGGGIRITSSFLSYELLGQVSGELKVGDLSTTEKELSHKVSLNLGKKFKYGLYYFSKTQDFSGELSYYRNSQGFGIHVGYKL
jgi:hypothetical protein